jgi:hypothetical protein
MGLTFNGMVLNLSGISVISTPDSPIIGTATATGADSATVEFFAPPYNGGAIISSYTAVSNPGGITSTLTQSGSGTITVSGLTSGVSYTFSVYATNDEGNSVSSSASNQITTDSPPVVGQIAYTTAGTYTWIAPAGVSSVSVVAIGGGAGGAWGSGTGGGGGGGGGLGYRNNITVIPGNSYTVVVGSAGVANTIINGLGTSGGDSYFIDTSTVKGGGGQRGGNGSGGSYALGGVGGTYVGDGGGNGSSGDIKIKDYEDDKVMVCLYRNDKPNSINDVKQSNYAMEHPYEKIAYEIAENFYKNNKNKYINI